MSLIEETKEMIAERCVHNLEDVIERCAKIEKESINRLRETIEKYPLNERKEEILQCFVNVIAIVIKGL